MGTSVWASTQGLGVVRPWPGRRITVRNRVPGQGGAVVRRSVQDWNNAGIGIRFVIVKGKAAKKAQVTVKASRTSPCGSEVIGCAHIGRTRGATVWLLGRRGSFRTLADPVLWMNVTSHELGHILGMGHSHRYGSLMYPIAGGSTAVTPDGTCRHYTRTELKPLHRAYGKKLTVKQALVPRTSCRFAPLPGPVRGLEAVRRGQAVRLMWEAAARVDTYELVRGPATGVCPKRREARNAELVWAGGRTRAVDHDVREGATYCYRVFALSPQGFYRPSSSPRTVFRAATPVPAPPEVIVEVVEAPEWSAYALEVTGWTGRVQWTAGLEGVFEDGPGDELRAGEPIEIWARPDDGVVRLRLWQAVTTFDGEDLLSAPRDLEVELPPLTAPDVTLRLLESDTQPYEWEVTGFTGDLSYSVGETGFSDEEAGRVWSDDPYLWWWDRPASGRLYLRFWRTEYTVSGVEVRGPARDVVLDVPVRTG